MRGRRGSYNYKTRDAYQRWWLGKTVLKQDGQTQAFVTGVDCIGPPSFVYGAVELHYDDGTREMVNAVGRFRPRKMDVIVIEGGEKKCQR
jgi:hypothetical protein